MLRHRRTDPLCVRFRGSGRMLRVGPWRVRSLRRRLYDRGRGRSCARCMSMHGARYHQRRWAEMQAAEILADLQALNDREPLREAPGRAE